MTIDISNNNPRINYSVAEGVTQTTFSVPFEFFEDGDLTVYVDGVEKTITTDYSVTGGDGSTGTIQFVTADPGETQQVTGASGGSTVTIVRDIPIERTTDFTAGADINRAALNTQLDTIIGLIADVDDRASRSLQLNDYETAASVTLPSLDSRKGYTLAFNASTGDAEVGPLVTDVAAASTHATNAAASATAAAASESNAATSETNAASSATAAATSETNAATSETNAASSAAAASSSETNAAASESAAATSASNAATSETNAATSETNAATSATNAASSATSAASAQTAAEAARDATLLAYDNFDDRYLGAKASDPTLDNDGNALVAGSLYFNTTYEEMKVYTGSLWVAAYVSGTGFLAAANNLSDLPSAATARTNLGLGTAATTDSTAYATAAQGANADTAFGWGNHASAGYLTSITGQSIENLSDVSAMTPAEGQALVYSSGSWSAADMAGGIAYVRKTANYTASANEGIIADTSGGSFTVTLPASPATGDTVIIADGADWSTNNLTVGRNGSTIEGDAADMTMDLGNVSVQFTYDGTTWQAYAQVGVAGDGVTLTGVQTLTNKTLTSPVITSPDIDLGSDATGDILYRNSGGSIARLGIGSTDQVLTVASGLPSWADAGGGGGLQSVQVFTSSGTWTRPAGITKVKIYVTGGGGGASRVSQGGGEYAPDAASGGGTAIKLALDVSSISSATITVGAGGVNGNANGGTSSWSDGTNTISATGGARSISTPASGVGSGGDINMKGGIGLHGGYVGGSSFWDGGPYEAAGNLGSGGACPSNTGSVSGGNGIVIVEEYA